MFWFKKKPKVEEEKNPRLASVLDRHLSKYIRVVNINNSVKTAMILFGLTFFMFNILIGSMDVKKTDHIASIGFTGTISTENPMANARSFSEVFFKAIEDTSAKAIVIIANSGGGSPTQAEAINQMVSEYTALPLAERKPVYVTVQEVCASACVLAFASADKIMAHHNSLVGSISVRMDGWAIDKFLKNLDIERKVITTGKYKALFDPYRNLDESEADFIRTEVMGPMHKHFVDTVIAGRGDKLDLSNEMLFTGMIWTGQDGVSVGLVDQIQSTYYVEEELKEMFSVSEVKRYNRPPRFNLKGMFGASIENAIRSILTEDIQITM
ncbi:S49 family peptidase [Rheinheimera sp.]|uniref:S49 family peptidase n=1 Tax=Rheinheimera sp. TaxID=1869214 RepID=UPI004048B0DD